MSVTKINRRSPFRLAAIGALGIAGFAALGGCASNEVTLADIRAAPAPEFLTTGQTRAEVLNDLALELDTARRAFNSDARRAWLFDQPSNLTPTLKTRSP